MQSKDPWFLNFGSDNCPECKRFESIYEQAAETQKGEVKYGYIDITKEVGIVNFFGIGGQNHQIFLAEDKPEPAGAPSFFSWPKDLKNVLSFAKNEIYVKKRQPLFRGTKHMQILRTKSDLDNIVLKSKDPWFILFCSDQQPQQCYDIIGDYHDAAVQMKGRVKFGFVDSMRSEIVNVFGINGVGVTIFMGIDKPGPVGGPQLVGSELKKKDYEKHVWDILEDTPITPSTQALTSQYSSTIPDVTYQQIMRHDGPYLVLFYTGSEVFEDNEKLKQQMDALSQMKCDQRIKIGKMSVDENKWIVGHFDIWPIPTIKYFPIHSKSAETTISYKGQLNAEELGNWANQTLEDNVNDKQVVLNRQNFDSQVMNSQEAWFIQFYTLNSNYCRKCEHLLPEWKKLSGMVDGKLKIAKLNCDVAKDICQHFQVYNFPKLLYFPAGQKSWQLEKNIDYEGAFSKDAMYQFAMDKVSIHELATVAHIQNQEVFDKYCKNFNGICVISVLPEEGKGSNDRQWYINQINQANQELSKEPVSFTWIQNGEQKALQERFDLCDKGFPCSLALDYRVDKERGFKIFIRKFSADDLKKNINDLLTERRGFIPLKKDVPQISSGKSQDNRRSDL
uniref:Protein disulfide-isomerase n=1 Tax=Philasterides dicentrarchi TaxID=282688 RepID=A0A5J6DVB7_9CILI|nr:protein disulfide-isomerase [Philasterides dicentrarchi]